MDLYKKKVLFVSQFAAPYEGNFLASLKCLEGFLISLYDCSVGYVFPELAKSQSWYKNFVKEHLAFTTCNNPQNAQGELDNIKKRFNPDIVHTHFDGYDVVVKHVFEDSAKIVWHMRNHISYQKNPLKALYQVICFWYHYGYESKGVSIISVSRAMTLFADKWQQRAMRTPGLIQHIPNGINLSRVVDKRKIKQYDGLFRFLSFGGRNSQKRIDILLRASIELSKRRKDFSVVITKGLDTEKVINEIFGNEIPCWLDLKEQTQDIATLFNSVDCYVNPSCHETFCNAICEASVFGLPVIQSDIESTLWNAQNPSVRLFHVNDANDLCEKMLLQMNENREELEMKLQITIRNNMRDYSLEQWASKVIDFYKQIK